MLENGAPGRLPGVTPVGVIDIGSNSVRLVVYEGLTRSPTPIFNEKALCGLGAQIGSTGRLDDEAVEAALGALRRFRALAEQMRVGQLHVIATAAVREASNGSAFIAEAEAICKARLRVLTGADEAWLTMLGVLSGIHDPDGLAGDLGGGSLELIATSAQSPADGSTLPLGVLRLRDLSGGDVDKVAKMARTALKSGLPEGTRQGRDFYAIGGTFRSFARLHMAATKYPLHVTHYYTIEAPAARRFARALLRGKHADKADIAGISETRRALLPYGAAVLDGLISTVKPQRIVFSALGVREGLLYEQLGPVERERDALIAAAEELALLRSRSPRHARELVRWTDLLFTSLDMDETDEEKRLRHATALLADIGWRAHPDYRGEQSVNIVANAAFVGIDHPGRVFMAMALTYRHAGLNGNGHLPGLRKLAPARLQERARILGGALRVAYLITASMAGVLDQTTLQQRGDRLVLRLPESRADLGGGRLASRLRQLGRALGLDAEIEVV